MKDSFKSARELNIEGQSYHYYSLKAAQEAGLSNIDRLPFSLKVLLENLLRHEDGLAVDEDDIRAFSNWVETRRSDREIAYYPARVLMQDFTGVPAVVDLAAMRAAMLDLKGDPQKINPLCPVDLVIDHSVQVDDWKDRHAYEENVSIEMQRNHERYEFLRWGQKSFKNFRVVPPGTGICHQVNLEYLAKTIWSENIDGKTWAFPDTLVGTDSHTTMINGLGVLGWGVGGIEAEAAMLGQPISMLIPEVIGFKLSGQLKAGVTATDLVLTVTEMLRKKGVVSKFVEFFGPGLKELTLADRATIGNMSPEYGATCGLFPIDAETLNYLTLTGRSAEQIQLVKHYAEAQGLWHDEQSPEPVFTDVLNLDLSSVEPSLAGPKRPQDRVALHHVPEKSAAFIKEVHPEQCITPTLTQLESGSVVIAAITSCTNTSNPSVMLAAGLLAKKAIELGLSIKPWVKPSLAPGSKVVTEYLNKTGLTTYLEQLGFYLVGYGCTTCIGNSGPLSEDIANVVNEQDLTVSAVLSGNRNFEGRIHPQVKANWLASPPLVVAYALAGSTLINLSTDPIAFTSEGKEVFLKDLWPSPQEIQTALTALTSQMYTQGYADVFSGTPEWQAMPVTQSDTYAWNANSTYIQHPTFFTHMKVEPEKILDIQQARILAILGDSVTTDHISPAGSIKANSPAGLYLKGKGVEPKDFNSYGARRGNHEVMIRGTFANIRIRNEMVPGVEGGFTQHQPEGTQMPIYDAAMQYQQEQIPLVIIAGKEYGTGSSRDWAAKGTLLLGVKAVIAESFERIHRSNLIGMGVLPLKFDDNQNRKTLKLTGNEIISLSGLEQGIAPKLRVNMHIQRVDGSSMTAPLMLCIDTEIEAKYFLNGGILQYVLRKMLN